ncbi:MAG: hypothetical protein ACK40G_04500 [Cytophagaceae bacterium]
MNAQEIINSGKLDCLVLGVLPESEAKELEMLIIQNEELKQEYNNLQKALTRYVMAFEKTPPLHLKKKVLENLTGKPAGRSEKIILESTASGKSKIVAIVFGILLFIAIGNILFLYLSHLTLKEEFALLTQKSQELTTLSTVHESLKDELNNTKEHLNLLKEKLDVINDTLTRKVVLKSKVFDDESRAVIFWNPSSYKTYIEIHHLTDPGTGMKYRLWSVKEKMMQDAGLIDSINPEAFFRMADVESAEAFVVTLEGHPSSEVDLPNIILEGKVPH